MAGLAHGPLARTFEAHAQVAPGAPRPVFRYATTEPAGPIDPRTVTGPARAMATNLFEGLSGVEPDGRTRLLGARAVRISEDGRAYTFALRPEVRWSDGARVTARDYVFAYRSALDPAFASQTANILYPLKNAEAINARRARPEELGARAVDDHTLELTLERPKVDLIQSISTAYVFMPVPEHVVARHGTSWTEPGKIVTNGPYTIAEWRHNSHAVLQRNPHYWDSPPYIAEVRIALVGDPLTQALTMFEAGDLDYAAVSRADLARVRGDRALAGLLQSAPVPRLYAIFVDHRRPPFSDQRVRQAIYGAIDREALARISGGQLVPSYGVIPHLVPGHGADLRPRAAADPRRLLAEAGYPDGQGLPAQTLVVRNSAIEILQAEVIQAMLRRQLNVTVNVQTLEPSAFRGLMRSLQDALPFSMVLFTATADTPDPWLYHNFMIAENGEGYYRSYWRNEEYNELLRRSDRETDPERRIELYRRLDRLVVEHAATVPIANENLFYVVRPSFTGVTIPFGERDPNVARVVPTRR